MWRPGSDELTARTSFSQSLACAACRTEAVEVRAPRPRSVRLDAHPVGGVASLVRVLIGAHILGVGEARVFRRMLGADTGRQALHRPVNATIEEEGNGI